MSVPSPLITALPIAAAPRSLTRTTGAASCDAGTTLVIPFAATSSADGTAVDLSAATVAVTITTPADHLQAPVTVATLAIGAGVTLTSPTGGTGDVVVPTSATSGILGYSLLEYEIQVTLSDGTVWVIQRGSIAVTGAQGR